MAEVYEKIAACLSNKTDNKDFSKNGLLISEDFFKTQADALFSAEAISQKCAMMKVGAEVSEALVKCAKIFSGHEALKRYAAHIYYLEFIHSKENAIHPADWNADLSDFGEYANLSASVALVAGCDKCFENDKALGIPEEITIDTLSDVELWIAQEHTNSGKWQTGPVAWLSSHFKGGIYKLGRLQFQFSNNNSGAYMQAFENINDKRIVVLANDGSTFRKDGQFNGANNITDPDCWTAQYSEDGDCYTGTPINPKAFAENRTVQLPKSEWKKIFSHDSKALALHIPASGKMSHDICGKSFEMAFEFFPKYFPDFKFDAVTCSSWLFDAQFEDHLKPESNIVAFLREFYLLPLDGANDKQTIDRVFGKDKKFDLETAPQDSSLQRAIVKHMKNGNHWRMTASLCFPGNFNWGKCIYRENFRI